MPQFQILEQVCTFLEGYDLLNCRLINQQWNSVVVKHLKDLHPVKCVDLRDPNKRTGSVMMLETNDKGSLTAIHKVLTKSPPVETRVSHATCIYGEAGVGKSALARMYAHQNRDYFDGNVLWINADSLESMQGSFTRLAERINVPVPVEGGEEVLARRIYEFFEGRKVLFIFDDVRDADYFELFRPKPMRTSDWMPYVLTTSRELRLAPEKYCMKLDHWGEAE